MSETVVIKWIMFGLTIAGTFLGLASYSFSTFETVSHADAMRVQIDRRLERIENKLDALLMQKQK